VGKLVKRSDEKELEDKVEQMLNDMTAIELFDVLFKALRERAIKQLNDELDERVRPAKRARKR